MYTDFRKVTNDVMTKVKSLVICKTDECAILMSKNSKLLTSEKLTKIYIQSCRSK